MTAPSLAYDNPPYGRWYRHPGRGKQVPSITNIKDKKGISALKYWSAKKCAEYASENIAKLSTLTPEEIYTLVRGAPFAKSSEKEVSAAIGDVVHNWIDRYIKGEIIPPEELEAPFKLVEENGTYKREYFAKGATTTIKNMWRQFGGLVKQYQPKFVAAEFTVWSEKYGYAGTADWAARVNGALVLGDTKTGNDVYDDTAMQLAALANADFLVNPDGTERNIPPFEMFAVLHVRPMYAKLVPYDIDGAFEEFLGCKAIFDYEFNHKGRVMGWAPKIETRVGAK